MNIFLSDLISIFYWWFVCFALGLAIIPITTIIFADFFDKGYPLAKIISLGVITYIVWVVGMSKLFPFSNVLILAIICIVSFLSIFIVARNFDLFMKSIKSAWKFIVLEEFLFLILLTSWSIVRGFNPDIRGLEKFMDFGFVNSILNSKYFPPQDMWFAGLPINYYYFGHLITAVLIKLTNVPSSVGYNLMMSTLLAFCFSSSFSILGNLLFLSFAKIRSVYILIGGFIGAILLNFSSNMQPLYWFIKNKSMERYWYPDATRFIVSDFGASDNTIHEFPIYSYVVSDLHGHILNLPFVMVYVAFLIKIFLLKKISITDYLFISFLLCVFYITNTWDFPIYSGLLGLVMFGIFFKRTEILRSFLTTFKYYAYIILGSLFFCFPFLISFKNISQGIAFVDFHTPIWMLLVLWGAPVLVFVTYLFVAAVRKELLSRENVLVLGFFLVSVGLIVLPEIVYVKDIYIHEYQRANTMFKFTYQAFVLFSIVVAFSFTKFFIWIKLRYTKFVQFFTILPILGIFLLFCIYPYFAVRSFYRLSRYEGLDGEKWITREYPGEYKALQYIRKNSDSSTVIVEANGDSYTDFNMISSYSGVPTVLGWFVHEWLWRGGSTVPSERAQEVEKIYTSKSRAEVKKIIEKYNISFIVYGSQEKSKYPQFSKENILKIAEPVFTSSEVIVFKVVGQGQFHTP